MDEVERKRSKALKKHAPRKGRNPNSAIRREQGMPTMNTPKGTKLVQPEGNINQRIETPLESTARSDGLTKLTPWAGESLGGKPKEKAGTLRKLKNKMKSWLTATTSEDKHKGQSHQRDHGRPESPKHGKEDMTRDDHNTFPDTVQNLRN